jgi:DNA invertase Pin-like site-specific DNA recombinase
LVIFDEFEEGRERLFQDQLSGTPADRPSIREARSYLREGDNLVVWKLDRLGRGVKGLVDLVAVSAERKGHLLSPTDQIDTLMATGRFSFRIMASLAHLERELIVERTQAGLGAARRPCLRFDVERDCSEPGNLRSNSISMGTYATGIIIIS